jgi:hypothetical protein
MLTDYINAAMDKARKNRSVPLLGVLSQRVPALRLCVTHPCFHSAPSVVILDDGTRMLIAGGFVDVAA